MALQMSFKAFVSANRNKYRPLNFSLSKISQRLNEVKLETVTFGELKLLEGLKSALGQLSSYSHPFVKAS